MAASDGLPRAWETVTSGRRGIVGWRGRRSAWHREAQPMAAEASSAREARAVEMEAGLAQAAEMEAGLAREAQPMEGGRIGARRSVTLSGGWSGASLLLGLCVGDIELCTVSCESFNKVCALCYSAIS
uniref:Uncharacterized protein n=1 Tax=Oryza sativa TaxID=4530 RepID=Q949B6_ORYSA|nr:putative protein [Oryza sativa]